MVLLLSTDLMFASRFRSAAGGVETGMVLSAAQALTRAAEGDVRAVCVDLELSRLELASVVQELRQRGVLVVAYGPHVHTARLEAARTAGCDLVLSRGAFDRSLPELLTALSAGRLP